MIKSVKHWLMMTPAGYDEEPKYGLYPFDMSNAGEEYVVVKTLDIDLDIPDHFDPRQGMIDALERQRQKAKADFVLLMASLDSKIQQLKCIEHKPAPDLSVDPEDVF